MAEGTLAQPGDVIAKRYRVESWLGQGNMAIVYQCKHVNTGKTCALKLVHPHLVTRKEFVELFVKEAQLGARIGSNPHIVDVFDAGVDEARRVPYLAMELLQGETLESYIKKNTRVSAKMARTMFEHLADALDQAHQAGVIHRDLKPGNLFISKDRKGHLLVKVMDFGIAKVLERQSQRTATQIGSPAYAAPEQLGSTLRSLAASQGISISQGVSAATDVWALGLVAYEALTGCMPGQYWGVETYADLMICIALEEQAAASQRAGDFAKYLPPGFDGWFSRCIQRNAADRWQSAGDAVGELVRIIDGWRSSMSDHDVPSSSSMKAPPTAKPPTGAKPQAQKPVAAAAPAPTPAPAKGPAASPSPLTKSPGGGPLRPAVTGLPLKLQVAKSTSSSATPAVKPVGATPTKPSASAPAAGSAPVTPTPAPAPAPVAPPPASVAAPAPTPAPAPVAAPVTAPAAVAASASAPVPVPASASASASASVSAAAAPPPEVPSRASQAGPPPKPPGPPPGRAAPPPIPRKRGPPPAPPKAPPVSPKERARLQEQAIQFEKDMAWTELCDVLRKLAEAEPAPERKARYVYQLGLVYLERLDQPERAVELLDEALDKAPGFEEAFYRIVGIHEARGDWKKLERAHRKMLHRHAGTEDTGLKHQLWHSLGEIYRDRFGNPGAAVEAFRMAVRFAPKDADDHLALADLCAHIGEVDNAINAYQDAIRADPGRLDAYRQIYRLSIESGSYDPGWCAAAALAFLREADEEQVRYFQDYRPDGRIQVKSRFDHEIWGRDVFHEDQSPVIGKIFEFVARAALKAKTEGLRRKNELPHLDPFMRQDPTTSSVPFVRTMGWAARVINVPCPALFIRDVPGAVVAVPSEPPSSVVGQTLLSGFSAEELAYIAGKHLAMYRPEHYIKLLFPSAEELTVIFHAAVKMAIPDVMAPHEVEVRAEATAKVLRQFMGPREVDGLRTIVRKLLSDREVIDIPKYFRAVEHTATRAGFILTGDLGVAKKIIAAEPTLEGDPSPGDKMKDLLAYSVSESYLAVRRALGIGVGQEE